tara:strand:+ start:3667 stop:4452 length:786 start_codon:yes stop_codon:yes gene_type:complete
MKIFKLINKILWFLVRPKYYLHFTKLILKKIKLNFQKNSEILNWCLKNSIENEKAIELICGSNDFKKVNDEHKDIFSEAVIKVKNCPVKMGGSGNIDLLFNLCEHFKVRNVLETGVAYGWSSLSILLSISKRDNYKLISTDMPYPGLNNSKYVGLVVPEYLKKNWKLIRESDSIGLPKVLKNETNFDLCHYDSDKYYEGRMWAYPKLWKALKKGGLLVSDDIENNNAFKHFSESLNKQPYIIRFRNKNKSVGYQFVGVLIK